MIPWDDDDDTSHSLPWTIPADHTHLLFWAAARNPPGKRANFSRQPNKLILTGCWPYIGINLLLPLYSIIREWQSELLNVLNMSLVVKNPEKINFYCFTAPIFLLDRILNATHRTRLPSPRSTSTASNTIYQLMSTGFPVPRMTLHGF